MVDVEDDFVEIVPPGKSYQSKVDPTLVNVTYQVVGKKRHPKLLVTIPKQVYDALEVPADRFNVAYSPRRSLVRLSHDLEGSFEVCDVPPGRVSLNAVVKRPHAKMLRFPAPDGLSVNPGTRKSCEYEISRGVLQVKLPGDWYRTYSSGTSNVDPDVAGKQMAQLVANRPAQVAAQSVAKTAKSLAEDYGPERVRARPVGQVVSEPGMPPPGRSALDQGAKPGGGLVTARP